LIVQERLALIEATGLAPLAARPARQLLIAAFAVELFVIGTKKRQSVLRSQNGSHPQILSKVR